MDPLFKGKEGTGVIFEKILAAEDWLGRKIPHQSLFLRFPCNYQNKCVSLQRNRNYIHRIIMEATVNKIQVNVMTVANAVVVKETTYQKLKRLSKKYNLQTNDPKFARV